MGLKMNRPTVIAIAAAGAAAIAFAGFAQAAPSVPPATETLSLAIAASAASAEKAAKPDAVQAAVRGAVQNTIITAAADPIVVLSALDRVLSVCRVGAKQYTCPKSTDAYAALNALRSIVIAQVEQTDPAALDTPGSAPFGEVPSVSPGGASYSAL